MSSNTLLKWGANDGDIRVYEQRGFRGGAGGGVGGVDSVAIT